MRKQVTIFFATFIFVLSIKAQDKYRAVHWTINNGLSNPDVSCILKDINGFLWIGSANGLNRFDGNNFKYYFSDKSQKTSIAGDNILGLSEDSLHNIWVSTPKGISRYDIKADTFTNFSTPGDKGTPNAIIPFWSKKNEMCCWDYNEQSIFSYNIHSFTRKVIVNLSPEDSIGGGSVKFSYSIVDEAGKCIWMLTERTQGGILQVSLIDGKRKFYPWPVNKNNRVNGHNHQVQAEAMRLDGKRNCIWINSPEGLINFTLNDKQFHSIDALNRYSNIKDYDRFVGIDIDLKGRLWFATQPKGIIIYNPADHSVELPFSNDSALQVDAGKFNACLYCDRDGMVWTGSWFKTGVYQLVPFSQTVIHYLSIPNDNHSLSDNAVIRFAKGDKGNIWMSTMRGSLNIFDSHIGKFDVMSEKDLPGVDNADFRSIAAVLVDTIFKKAWLEHNRLYEMDMETKKCVPVIFKDSIGQILHLSADAETYSLKFKNGCITRAAYGNRQGIFIVSQDSAIARELISFQVEEISPYINVVDDRLLFVTLQPKEKGHLTYTFSDDKLICTPIPLDSIQWSEVIYNKADQTYWVAAERQLIHYSRDFRIIRRYTSKEGLPAIDISSLTLDNRNNLWFHTDRSIHELNTETGVFSELSEKDGFDRMDFLNYPGGMKADNGDIYFPTGFLAQGFVRISPDKFISPPSSAYIEAIEVNQNRLPLLTGVNNVEQLSLQYFQNMITIEAGIIDYYSKGSSHIRFKLEGLNDNWQYGPANYNIRYDGLLPGTYKLLIQASNAANEFIGPLKTLSIHISPPWWKTWWAYVLYVSGFSILLWGFVQYRSRKLKQKNIELEDKVMHRTKELKQSLEELRETQAQLIQSEKMASLGELTAGIAHEIQNPLNFVNNFSDINTELIEELKTEAQVGNNEEVISIANDIKANEEKINHHGKRADAIVKGMLQHSRSSSGIKEPTDINKLADEYLRLAYHGLRAKDKSFNATLKTDFDERIGNIKIIPQDVGRVMLNLINNAFYAVDEKNKQSSPTSEGRIENSQNEYEPTVTVKTSLNPPSGSRGAEVLISVGDNGNGIPKKVIDKIFQPFFTTKPTGQGTGLGLSLSYDIIKAHGGELKVDSKEYEGSTFIIILPTT